MRTGRVAVQLCTLLCGLLLVPLGAVATPLTLSGNQQFSALDGSAQDADGLADGVFTVAGDLVVEGTIRCNDDAPLPPSAGACSIRISVAGNLVLEAGSALFAENRRASGNGGDIRLDVGGDLTVHGPDGSLPGAVLSTGRTTGTAGVAGRLTADAAGTIDLEAGSVLSAASVNGTAGAISVTGESVRVAGLVASGPSRTVLSASADEVLDGGGIGQTGGTILLRARGTSEPGLRIEPGAVVVSQGEGGGGRLVLLEACGIEVRGLVASLSRNNGPSQVALRSGKGILVDGRDLGSAAPAAGRFGRVRADGTQQGAAGYLVDLFAAADIQVLGPVSGTSSLFAVTSVPGDLPLRNAGGTITALSLEGALTASGNAFATGRDVLGGKGGVVDLQARNDVTLDNAALRSVGGYSVLSNAGLGGQIHVRSFQGAVSWTFGRGDVRPTGSLILPARRGTIEITACSTVDTTGSQFPVNGGAVAPFPVETEGVCSAAAPVLPDGEPPLPVCAEENQPPAPSGGPFSVPEDSANGTVVGTVAANDPNAGQAHTFSILSGNTAGAFAIDGAGVITVANSAALDFATNPVFTLTIEVTDDGTPPLSGTANVTIHVTNNPEAPVANDEGTPASPYAETAGNTILEVTASPVLGGAKVTFNGNVLANDTDPDGTTAFIVTLESATPGAVVALQSDGTFTYLPPPGFTGVDSFTYRITDPDGLFDTATVYLNVEHRVWYVKNDAASGGLGRSTEPFDTLAEAESASAPGDTIYLFAGDGTTAGQSDGITLQSGQRLLGEAVPLSVPETVNINGVDGLTLRATLGDRPKIENDDTPDAPGEDTGVSVPATAGDALGVEIRGLEIQGFDNAIDVTATGTLSASVTVRGNVIAGAGVEGIDVNAASTGTVTLAIRDNVVASAGTAIDIQRTAGTAYITAFESNQVSGSTGGTGINIAGAIFDAVPGGVLDPVNGGATVIGTPGDGVGQSGLVLTGVQGGLSFLDLDIFADGGAGLRVSGAGSGMVLGVAAGTGVIEATGGPAVDASSVALSLPLSTLRSTNSPTTGVALNSVTGTFSAEAGSSIGNITSGTGTAFQVGSSNAAITYKGTISTTTGKGVDLTGNTGSTIGFQGALTLNTGTNTAFNATGGGTVTATDTSSTLTTTTATALQVASTTIGGGGLHFRSISAGTAGSGPASGIVLNNTGSLGGLVVSGAGSAGSGGTIRKAAIGISLTSTRNVSLSWMQLNDFTDFAIRGASVAGFTLDHTVIDGINGDALAEGSVRFTELTGSATISSSSISGASENNITVINTTGTLNRLTISNTTLGANSTTLGSDGLFVEAQGAAVINATVQNSFFTSSRGDLAQFTLGSTGTMDVVIQGTAFSDNHPAIVSGGGGVVVEGTNGSMTFNVDGNTFRDATGSALAVSCGNAGQSCVGRIENNVIGIAGTANSGSVGGSGIAVVSSGGGTLTALINNNQVRQYNNHGILLQAGQTLGNPTSFNVTVTNNTLANPGSLNSNFNGIHLNNGTVPGESFTSCVDIRSNVLAGAGAGAVFPNNADFRLRQRQATTVRLPGYAGANNNDAAVVSFVSGNQASVTTGASANTVGSGGGGFVGGSACALP
jgi:Bacterial Ig domain